MGLRREQYALVRMMRNHRRSARRRPTYGGTPGAAPSYLAPSEKVLLDALVAVSLEKTEALFDRALGEAEAGDGAVCWFSLLRRLQADLDKPWRRALENVAPLTMVRILQQADLAMPGDWLEDYVRRHTARKAVYPRLAAALERESYTFREGGCARPGGRPDLGGRPGRPEPLRGDTEGTHGVSPRERPQPDRDVPEAAEHPAALRGGGGAASPSSVEEAALSRATAAEMMDRAGLTARQRQVFERVFVEEEDRGAAAAHLGMTVSTLNNTVSAIKRKVAGPYNVRL